MTGINFVPICLQFIIGSDYTKISAKRGGGILVNRKMVSNLRYTNDTILKASTQEEPAEK